MSGLSNLIVITADSTDDAGFFITPSVKIQLTGLNTESEPLQEYLALHGITNAHRNTIYRTPMLLLLAAKRNQVFQQFPEETLENSLLIPEDTECGVSTGEVLWNYVQSQILCANKQGKDPLVSRLLLDALPKVSYKYFLESQIDRIPRFQFSNHLMAALGLRDSHSPLFSNAIQLLSSMDVIHIDGSHVRIHPMFRDFFGMLHAANVISRLFTSTHPLTAKEEQVLCEPFVFDVTDKKDMMIAILSGVLYCTDSPNFKWNTLNMLDKNCNADLNTKIGAYQRFYLAIYALCCASFICRNEHPPVQTADEMSKAAFGYIKALGETLIRTPSLIAPVCSSFIFFVLAKSYRIGDLFGQTPYRPYIAELSAPDLRQSLRFGFAGVRVSDAARTHGQILDARIADDCCYIGKTYMTGYETIVNHLLLKSADVKYRLRAQDLILTSEDIDLPCLKLDEQERTCLLGSKIGCVLNRETALARAKRLRQIALWWLRKAKDNGSVLGMNLLGLIALSEQECLPAEKRDYRSAYELFECAASIPNHYATYYAASKAAMLLAEGRIAIDNEGKLCNSMICDRHKTTQRAKEWIRYALISNDQEGKCAYYQGLLLLAEGDKSSLRNACGYFIQALIRKPLATVCLALCEAALRLDEADIVPLIHIAIRLFVFGKASLGKRQIKGGSFKDYARNVIGERFSDTSKPSLLIFQETCAQARSIMERHRKTIIRLGLTKGAERFLACIDKQEIYLHERENKILDCTCLDN